MAEVGQRLWTTVYRLSAFKNSQSRAVSTGDSPAALRLNCSVSDSRVKKEPTRNQGDILPESEIRATHCKPETFPRVNESHHSQQNGSCAAALEVNSLRFSAFAQTREKTQTRRTALHQSFLHETPQPLRMSSWSREAVSVHPDTFKFNQQLRALCTVFFILAEQQESGYGPSSSIRSYSRSSNDAPLHRGNTTYYDILKVSPSATQSQIKTAYYKQSLIHHPDKNPGNKESSQHFIEITEAYAVLGNITLRKKYDRSISIQSVAQGASSRSTGSTQQQHHHHHHQYREQQYQQYQQQYQDRARRFSEAARKQREREMRARRERTLEEEREYRDNWVRDKGIEGIALVMMSVAVVLIIHICRS